MLYAYSEATVPKITVITRKAYGGSYIAMCSQDLRADQVIAWPTAEVAVMGPTGAANIIFKNDPDVKAKTSASLTPFADACPDQFVEMGIAEQNLVSVSAGLAKCGKKPFAASPACFLSTRSYEQIKVDAAYSNTNVKLIGISGGVSYGALGMSHHSAQDIAALSAIPNMRVYLPSDRFQTACLVKELLKDDKPAYIRVGRNAVEDIYEEGNVPFSMDKATVLSQGGDVAIIACGEMVKPALDAGRLLGESGISAGVVDMYCVKPLDEEAVRKAAGAARQASLWRRPRACASSVFCPAPMGATSRSLRASPATRSTCCSSSETRSARSPMSPMK